ncbi:hypothetical protein WH47_06175 [Habropoda laboriosa]|uniref:Uncharacterized protein n=1 Tax=Habropoda laboriosa TaxID=597456 RepID=A0A0L7QTN3_9HYME|nr:hypothetical protein WH47_06175 [Habropoda laboriosa]
MGFVGIVLGFGGVQGSLELLRRHFEDSESGNLREDDLENTLGSFGLEIQNLPRLSRRIEILNTQDSRLPRLSRRTETLKTQNSRLTKTFKMYRNFEDSRFKTYQDFQDMYRNFEDSRFKTYQDFQDVSKFKKLKIQDLPRLSRILSIELSSKKIAQRRVHCLDHLASAQSSIQQVGKPREQVAKKENEKSNPQALIPAKFFPTPLLLVEACQIVPHFTRRAFPRDADSETAGEEAKSVHGSTLERLFEDAPRWLSEKFVKATTPGRS